ncbi:hypothetical protein KSS87_002212 [Heliosperma pusillum]|nr:hypothetical protein KSS87_002212 [Heliosperma pusillum]
MSATPKRGPQEEGGHSSSSSLRPHYGGEEEPHAHPWGTYSSPINDNRRLPRPDSRDGERKSPLHSMYRIPSVAVTDSHSPHVSHPVGGPEVRAESRDSKETRESKGVENREVKAEPRDGNHQSGKIDKEGRVENKVDDSKEAKYERDRGNDSKSEVKAEKDVLAGVVAGAHPNWKDPHRVKRHPDILGGGGISGTWNTSQLRAKYEASTKEVVTTSVNVMKERVEGNEAVGENIVDSKADEKYKDRKRKEGKHYDWSESDKDKSDYRSNLQSGSSSNHEYKEGVREEKDSDRWEREKKDTVKEKERLKEREKDQVDKEGKNVAEKEGYLNEKDVVDKPSLPENITLDSKKPSDSWRTLDREAKERRKERDGDVEVERPEKRRCYEKESDDRIADVGEGTDKERDAFSYGVQQKKRLLRARGSPQVGNRDPRFKSRGQDAEGHSIKSVSRITSGFFHIESVDHGNDVGRGSDLVSRYEIIAFEYNIEVPFTAKCQPPLSLSNSVGTILLCKPEVSTVYKVGECLQELTKLWKEYESSQANKNNDNIYSGPTLEIRIPAEHVTATNRQVRGGQLWGTDIYTDDSDLVAVLMHTGYCRPTASPPPAAIQELRATIRILPRQDSYVSTLRNNVRSRAWGAAIGCSYRVERCCILKCPCSGEGVTHGGENEDVVYLEYWLQVSHAELKGGGTIDLEPCLTHTSTIEPTLAPVAVERTMTTRAAASNALRQQRFVREVTIQYNLCNEPWIKYSISIVADKGLKKPLYTSARLKKGEVLYLETHSCRYELCFASEKLVKNVHVSQTHESETGNPQNHVASMNGDRIMADGDNMVVDMFRWSKCKKPLPQKVMRSIGIPLPLDHVEVLEENVDWEDVQWSQTGVWIAGKEYQLARVHFLSPN